MPYDINSVHQSGDIIRLKEIQTRTGTPMVSIRIQCWKEQFDLVAFNEVAESILANYQVGSRIEIRGYIKRNEWEKEGTKYFAHQVVIKEVIDKQQQPEQPQEPENKSTFADEYDPSYKGGPF